MRQAKHSVIKMYDILLQWIVLLCFCFLGIRCLYVIQAVLKLTFLRLLT
jgi:hypothetical protein